jgi:DNA-binding PadR family transcriptional regulator
MKFLKKLGLVSEPQVEVRDNYIEKYYSMTSKAKQSLARGESEKVTRKIGEIDGEEFRQLLMADSALIQSATADAASQIKRVDRDVIADLKKKRSDTVRIIRCNKERYYELPKTPTRVGRAPTEVANYGELDYMIALLATPKLYEEWERASDVLWRNANLQFAFFQIIKRVSGPMRINRDQLREKRELRVTSPLR